MPDGDFLAQFGIRVPDVVSGLGGGVVNALFFQRAQPMDAVASVIGGAITANYMAGLLASGIGHIIGTEPDRGVAGFIVGVTAMAICQGLLVSVRGWIKRFQFGKSGGSADV